MVDSRTNSSAGSVAGMFRDALIGDPGAQASLHARLEEALRRAVRDGRLPGGTRLPPSRLLASDLGVSRGVVVEAYAQLIAEGYLEARTGAGTWVSATASRHLAASAEAETEGDAPAGEPGRASPTSAPPSLVSPLPAVRYDFRPGLPDLSLFPRAAWGRALQRSLAGRPGTDLGYADPGGEPAVRRALAAFLTRSRAAYAYPRDVVLTGGFAQGLALVCQVLRNRGHRRLAVEDPGLVDLHRRIRWHGLEPVPVAVDAEGLRVEDLDASGARAVLCTPAHQFPTGVLLSARRRTALVEWARRRGGWILEDDYDAEYRYDRQPVGSLQGLAPGRVIHAGTASKILGPGLRLGWLLVPGALADEVALAKESADRGVSLPEQRALADLLESGELDRHLRRSRQAYRQRRDRLLSALERHLPGARAGGIAAGHHLVLELPSAVDRLDETELARRAEARSLAVWPLTRFCIGARPPRATPPQALARTLVLGYTRLAQADLERGVEALAETLADLQAAST